MFSPSPLRRFFTHPAHDRIGVSAAAALWADGLALPDGPDVVRSVRVGLVADEWEEAAALLAGYLREECRLECRSLHWQSQCHPEHGQSLECPEHWQTPQYPEHGQDPWQPTRDEPDGCDCVVLLGPPAIRDARWLRRLAQWCRRGGGIVVVGSTRDVLPDWRGFARSVLGARDSGQSGEVPLDVRAARDARLHPVLAGVEPFPACGELLRGVRPARDAAVLLFGHARGLMKPVAWVRPCGAGRVFYCSLSDAGDLSEPNFLRLLANAVCWTAP